MSKRSMTPPKRERTGSEIPVGRRPRSKADAWWALSRRAREELLRQRLAGRFGGEMGKAPYWHVQEVGEPHAQVEPHFYLERALRQFHEALPGSLRRYLESR